MSQREVRVQFHSTAQRAHGLIEATQPQEQNTLCQVRPGVAVVEGERGPRLPR